MSVEFFAKGTLELTRLVPRLVFAVICLILVVFLTIRPIYFRRRVLSLLQDEITGKGLIDICEAIIAINAGCREHSFEVNRAGRMLFRGEPITLIWGCIDSLSVGSSSAGRVRNHALFALVAAKQVKWMSANADVFTPLFTGSPFSLFGVNYSALKAETSSQCSKTDAR